MQALRQMGGGMIIAFLSLLLVIGGISMALAENSMSRPPTPTQLPPPTLPPQLFAPTSLAVSPTITPTGTPTPSATASPVVVSCQPPVGWIQVVVGANDTLYTLAQKYKTTAENLSAANCLTTFEPPAGTLVYVPPVPTVTVIPCGPPPGWVRTHVVQTGDTLFRIALSYGITVPQLQSANCMGSSTLIYTGQRLWVPNVPTRTIPVTHTPTATATPTPTPTNTSTFIVTPTEPTATFIQTQTPTITPTPITPMPSP